MPAVSVIILSWNRGRYLQVAVDSILHQSMPDLEVVLMDNGSTDGSVDELERLRPDPRLRIFRLEKNLGVATATNLGVTYATAPWIAIMDSDDWAHPRRLEMQLQAAAVDPTLAVIGTGARYMDTEEKPGENFPMFYEPGEIAAYMPYGMPVLHPTLLVRSEVFENVPYRAGMEFCVDYDWASRVVERYRIGAVSLPLLHYRRHGNSVTMKYPAASQAGVCALRLAIARRRAGRPDGHAELVAAHARWQGADARLEDVFTHFAQQAAAEGFPLLAAFHAALAVRVRGGVANQWRYLRYFVRAMRADRGSWRAVFGAAGKGPFWALLKRAGFPPFPRY
jgi:glycosyltransferase involved in cell wall biosynthesis